jgi:hypothetical protein
MLQTLTGPFEGSLRPCHIDIFGTFGRIRQQGDVLRSGLHKASGDGEDLLGAACELDRHLPGQEAGEQGSVPRHHSQISLLGRDDE